MITAVILAGIVLGTPEQCRPVMGDGWVTLTADEEARLETAADLLIDCDKQRSILVADLQASDGKRARLEQDLGRCERRLQFTPPPAAEAAQALSWWRWGVLLAAGAAGASGGGAIGALADTETARGASIGAPIGALLSLAGALILMEAP